MVGNYYAMPADKVISSLGTSKKGISHSEAESRLSRYGLNEIKQQHKISPFKIFFRQFTSFIVMILIAAIFISLIIGERLDAIVIFAIVVLNAVFGFITEYRAEKAIEALRKMAALKATVLRDGKETEIDAVNIVPGDIIILQTGDKVPADARILSCTALEVEEASLTGESVPSKKSTNPLKDGVAVGDQENMVFMSTIVTVGHAVAVVTSTGMSSQIGKIADMVQEVKEKLTPLQLKLQHFGKWLGYVTIGICAVVFLVGILRQYLFSGMLELHFVNEMFLASVALAVAAIPEGLPAIVTISLALGVQRMVKRHALVRQLPSVETLGSADVICSDKTGTLTKNEMTVRQIYSNRKLIDVLGRGYIPEGKLVFNGKPADKKDYEAVLRIGTLCNNAVLRHDEHWKIFGDPTEGALIVSAEKAGISKSELDSKFRRIDEIPFDSERKLMTTIHKSQSSKLSSLSAERSSSGLIAFTKGAPDELLKKCSHIQINGRVSKFSQKDKEVVLQTTQDMASNALRILGFAYKTLKPKFNKETVEKDLVFVGLQAMIDPPRAEVKDAILKCESAGIRIVMITGDHKLTAVAIAKELGIMKKQDLAFTGEDIDKLSDAKFEDICEKISVYARVSPHHKSRILNALQKKGHIVAMTGDGVNDAPALKHADIGISMGIKGTDVAKEASDMILTDDNFASIVNAVEEGRGIYDGIKKFIQYTLSSNLGEILVIFLAILIGWPIPLIAIQILWVNLLTDGLPGLALGLDPFDRDLMAKPPRKKKESIMDSEVLQNILIVGIVMCIGTLAMYYFFGVGTPLARSIAFTTLITFQLFNVLTYRAKNFKIDIKDSKFLIGSVMISVLMQIAILYTPLNVAFKTVPLGVMHWVYIVLVSFSLYIILELRKMLLIKRDES